MWKQLILSGVLILATVSVSMAQNKDAELNPKDPKAKAILDKLSKKNKTYTSIGADFDYKLTSEDINEVQKGKIKLKGSNYILNIAGQQIINNGKMMITVIDNEATLNDPPSGEDDDLGLFDPSKIFTIYEEGFKYVYEKEASVDGKVLQIINLFPLEPQKQRYHTITLKVDKVKEQIYSMEIKSKDGNKYEYILTKFTPNVAVAAKELNPDMDSFDAITDLRDDPEY